MPQSAQARSPVTLLVAAIFAVLLLLFLYSIAEILLLLFVGVLFALYLGAITDFLQERSGLPRWMGLIVALLITTVGVVGVVWLILPPVLEQTYELLEVLPSLLVRWEAGILAFAARYPLLREMLPPPEAAAGGLLGGMVGNVGEYFTGIFGYLYSGLHFLIYFFSVLVMGIYLTLRPEMYREGIIALAPPVHRDLVRDILSDLANTLRAWIVGQILAMAFLGVLTWIGLYLLGVPYALAFGVFTAAVAIVPFFGTLVSTLLPALFVLGSAGPMSALLVALLGVVVHLLEANFVAPVIMERQVHLPPVLTILSVLVMAELLGVIGLLVAVPVLAAVMVIIRRIYIHRLLEGRGFRRTMRDSPAEIVLPAGIALVHPSVGQISVPAMLEEPVP